jgi:hypothetical protein
MFFRKSILHVLVSKEISWNSVIFSGGQKFWNIEIENPAHKHGRCWWDSRATARRRLPPWLPESTGPTFPPLCCICMFQVFHTFQMYVAIISSCKCFRGMLQVFVQNVYLVSDICCNLLLSGRYICFHTYITIACSKCFSCFQSYVAASSFML